MAHAFAPIPAKPAFGTFRQNLYQSDYIKRKNAKIIYCNSKSVCGRILKAADYKERLLFNFGQDALNLLRCSNAIIPINKSNLIMGQYTKLDLKPVCTVINTDNYNANDCLNNIIGCPNNSPVIIDPSSSTPFYQKNIIDPCGGLFGNTQCGELNYTSYMIFYPPTVSPII
jgi:hypothetical protein